MAGYLVDRMSRVPSVDEVLIATTSREIDDPLQEWADKNNIASYRGDLKNVLLRLTEAARNNDADIIVRANGDNPLLAPEAVEAGLEEMHRADLEYVTGKNLFTGLPVGIGSEMIRVQTLERLNDLVKCAYHKEHVTTYIFENLSGFAWGSIPVEKRWQARDLSVTVDTAKEFKFVEKIIKELPETHPANWRIEDIINASTEVSRSNNE